MPVTLLIYGTVLLDRGLDFYYVQGVIVHYILYINHPDYFQSLCKPAGIVYNGLFHLLVDSLGRVYRNTVARMHAGSFEMFHYTRYQYVFTVANGVNLDLLAHQVFVYKYGMFLLYPVYDFHEFDYVLVGIGYLHALAAQNIGRTHQHRVNQIVCGF